MDKELLYNQSGIKDETAYKAITNLRSGGGSAYMNGYEINKGEIWEAKDNNYGTRLVVVLNCYEKYAATVMLQEQQPGSNGVPVRARDIMYADTGRLGWTFYDKMVDFVRKLSEDEDQELRKAIAYALELPLDEQPYESMAEDANREIDGLQYEIAQLRKELATANETIDNQAEELEEAAKRVAELEEARRVDNNTHNAVNNSLRQENAELREVARQGATELVEERGLREELAAAQKAAEIYKELYSELLYIKVG